MIGYIYVSILYVRLHIYLTVQNIHIDTTVHLIMLYSENYIAYI